MHQAVRSEAARLRWVSALVYRNADKVVPFGTRLEPGRVMLSGSFTPPVWAKQGDTLRADFGLLGSLSVQFV